MRLLSLTLLPAALLGACSQVPVADSLAGTAAPAERAPGPVCVVSLEGDDATCAEALAPPPPVPENDEPCVERLDPNAFAHGPGARIHAFCTPQEAARKAARAVRGEPED